MPDKLMHVIRPDGTVPFDDDVPDEIRALHIGALHMAGHVLDPVPGTRHYKIRDFKGHPPPKAG